MKASEDVRRAKIELASFEGVLKAEVEGLEQVMTETTIWLRDNHTAVSTSAEEIQQRLSRQHIEIGGRYMELIEAGQVTAEEERQGKLREELRQSWQLCELSCWQRHLQEDLHQLHSNQLDNQLGSRDREVDMFRENSSNISRGLSSRWHQCQFLNFLER